MLMEIDQAGARPPFEMPSDRSFREAFSLEFPAARARAHRYDRCPAARRRRSAHTARRAPTCSPDRRRRARPGRCRQPRRHHRGSIARRWNFRPARGADRGGICTTRRSADTPATTQQHTFNERCTSSPDTSLMPEPAASAGRLKHFTAFVNQHESCFGLIRNDILQHNSRIVADLSASVFQERNQKQSPPRRGDRYSIARPASI